METFNHTAQAWLVIGPLAVTVAGWFLGVEIRRMRNQIDQLLNRQMEMAVHIAQLQTKLEQLT